MVPEMRNHATVKPIDNPAALILSAGYSQRMGRFKPLLPLGDGSVVERVVALYRGCSVNHILVVTGHEAATLRAAMGGLAVQWVLNPAHDKGMFSSILAGLRALPEDCDAFFVHPVDIPLIRSQTIRQLLAAGGNQPESVIHPVFAGRRGHPPLIRADLRPQILQWSGRDGLRGFLQRHDANSVEIPVADEGVLLDLDTPEDYRSLLAKAAREGVPSNAECRMLMEQIVALPEAVIYHCRAVATVAQVITTALNAAGGRLDAELVYAAALLHDIGRTRKTHAQIGAQLLNAHGFGCLSPIVRVHMDISLADRERVDEAQVVFLADKLVSGDRRVDLARRFDAKMVKYGHDSAAAAQIARRRENATHILARVESLTGRTLGDILNAAGLLSGERICSCPGIPEPAAGPF